jgi:very-short-patch-repair endonuclease
VDTDGRAFHAETFEEDRRRDLGTEWIGLRSLRIPATYVFTEWDWVSETIARLVREGLAIRRRRTRP